MLRRNMLTADCQNSGVKGKRLGLHSTVFSESDDENTRLNNKNQSKKAEKRWQLWSRDVARWCRCSLSVAGPFGCRCLTSLTMLPFPHPAHRTGQACFRHPALGESFTMSPTGDCSSA